MRLRIVTDSTCDLPADVIARYGICVLPLYLNVGKQSFLDGIDMTRDEFYSRLPTFPVHPTTAGPSPQKFRLLYETLAKQGASDVLTNHVSTTWSGVVNVAQAAARETASTRVTVLDSRQLSLGLGFLVETAAKLAAAGHSVSEIKARLTAQIERTHVFAVLDTLEFLKRSGRVNQLVASLGNLLQIKPILTVYDGQVSAERVRTHERALARLVEMLHGVGPLERVALVHAAAPKRVAELRAKAATLLPTGDLLVADVTPTIGVHIGPGAAGFVAVAA